MQPASGPVQQARRFVFRPKISCPCRDGNSILSARHHTSFLAHRRGFWAKIALLICATAIGLYVFADASPVRNGGSWAGYTLGSIGATLIVWLAWLGIRKRRYGPGRSSLKGWTSAHVYLGLALMVIGTLHTGFQFGWNVHTLAYVLMSLVVLSGMFGLVAYTVLPRRMSDNRAESTQQDMLDELDSLTRLAGDRGLSLPDAETARIDTLVNAPPLRRGLLARLRRGDKRCANQATLHHLNAQMRQVNRADQKAYMATISVLERRNILLDRIRRHRRYRLLMQIWLWVHIPLTIMLLAALLAHIIAVFYYQ